MELGLNFTLQRLRKSRERGFLPTRRQAKVTARLPTPASHRELHLVVLIPGYERPPSFHALLFEDGDGGKLVLVSDHVEGALLGRLGAAREPAQVQLDRA